MGELVSINTAWPVFVQREWDSWRSAEVRLRDLTEVHWCRPEGAPRLLVHAYVLCSDIVSGDLSHQCDQTTSPHRLLVCILKRRCSPAVYSALMRRADSSPMLSRLVPFRTPDGMLD